jgi:hypothetical protein
VDLDLQHCLESQRNNRKTAYKAEETSTTLPRKPKNHPQHCLESQRNIRNNGNYEAKETFTKHCLESQRNTRDIAYKVKETSTLLPIKPKKHPQHCL